MCYENFMGNGCQRIYFAMQFSFIMSVFISENVDYSEAVRSRTADRLGLDNSPSQSHLTNMRRVAERVFEPLRREVSKGPLAVTSFYRSVVVNRAVGGSASSQHTRGEAMDIDADIYGGCTNRELFDYVRSNLEFDQLIWEFGDNRSPDWIHVSLKASGNRREVLRSVRHGGKTEYYKI